MVPEETDEAASMMLFSQRPRVAQAHVPEVYLHVLLADGALLFC